MPEPDETPTTPTEPSATPETTAFLLATFADLCRQEVGGEEDVHRALPFFGTALGIVIGALAYAAGRLPKWPDLAMDRGLIAFVTADVLLGLAVVEAGCVLIWISLAIARHNYQRIGPETGLRARVAELQAYYDAEGISGEQQDRELLKDTRQMLLELLHHDHAEQPRDQSEALQVPGEGGVSSGQKLDLGAECDQCYLRR